MTIFNGSSKNEKCHEEVLADENEPSILSSFENRKKTDRWFLFIFIICLVMMLPLLTYTLMHADINRYNGHDSCGNICGQENIYNDQWGCSGQDMTFKPFQLESTCVNEKQIDYPESWDFENLSTNIKYLVEKLTISFLVPFVSSIILAIVIRYLTAYTVLVVFWLFILACTIYYGIVIYMFVDVIILVTISYTLFSISIPKTGTLGLVNTLMKEASRVVFSIRSITFNAAMTSIVSLAMVVASWVIYFWLKTSRVLMEVDGSVDFIPDAFMEATLYLTPMIFFWIIEFVISVGYLNTSEAIVSSYFLRNRERCTRNIALKYHSGTVALASLLSTIMSIPRVIIIVLAQIPLLRNVMYCCLRYLDAYFSKNVYIMTAMNGTQLSQSGKRAVELFRSSVGNTEYVNFFGNTLIVLIQLSVTVPVIASLMMYYCEIADSIPEVALLFLTVYTGTEIILGPFKIAFSTIFFCMCEDNLQKKESNKSYAMSKTDYLDSSHKFFEEKVKENWLSRTLVHPEEI